MNYDEFLTWLKNEGWTVPNRSLAHKSYDGWQVAFIRMGGRFQIPAHVAFVVCVRHLSLRNLKKELTKIEKEPHSYPFKFTLEEIEKKQLKYESKLLRYDVSQLPSLAEWDRVVFALDNTIPEWILSYTLKDLASQINGCGQSGYIEEIWREDLKEELQKR